ncbi:hypothetical protein [Microtetraspora niveoalba]|uniref:hypothetical protein n=1 Tax=Microtetraspora niveoalba TaxID=46175 RepID=UPI000A5B2F98|nr:hypothetical protein [Microtetraspora niveoalba]
MVATAFAGFAAFILINFVGFLVTLGVADSVAENKEVVVGVAAVILAAIALGGGVGLVLLRRPWTKGLGLGLMIGWALVSILSVGFCTGVNPDIYTGGTL